MKRTYQANWPCSNAWEDLEDEHENEVEVGHPAKLLKEVLEEESPESVTGGFDLIRRVIN